MNATRRFRHTLAAIIFCALVVGGCASNFQGALPPLQDPLRAAEFVVLRPARLEGTAVGYGVQIDGKDAFALRSGQYARFRLDAGEHSLTVRCLSDPLGTFRSAVLRIDAGPGETRYVLVSPGREQYCALLSKIDEAEAAPELAKGEAVPTP